MDTPDSNKSTTGRTAPLFLRGSLGALHWIAPGAAASIARTLYFRPVRTRPLPAQTQVIAHGAESWLEDEGERVAVRTWGQGAPVALVHGWSGQMGQLTPFVEPLLAQGHQVIAFDWPGHGASQGSSSNLFRASRILRELQRRSGSFAGVIAHSFGAVAVLHACAHGLKADRLVFHAPVARIDRYVDEFARAFNFSLSERTAFVEASERWLQGSFGDVEPMFLAPRVAAPVHIIHSEDDREVEMRDVLRLAATLEASVTRRVALGHRRSLKDADAIDETLRFLAAGATSRKSA